MKSIVTHAGTAILGVLTSAPSATELGITAQLSHALAHAPALPAEVKAAAQSAVLDWLGSAMAGAFEPQAVMVRQVAAGLGHGDDATVFGALRESGHASAAVAALCNGVAAHILELDDLHQGATIHAGAPVVSAAVAMAERLRASGPRLLRAIAIGYEAALRIGEAVNPAHYRFWHPTGTSATFGAAAAAGSLLNLDASRMRDALGSAGTQAAGLWEFNADGTMSKHLHPGKAAFNGILAADLALAGFTGASQILEGERGFFPATTGGAFDASRITDGLGKHWKILENGYKLYACCGHTHSAVDAALALRPQIGSIDDISSVEISTYAQGHAVVKNSRPESGYQAQFSLAYATAVALLEGRVGLAEFRPASMRRVAELLPRVKIQVDDDLTAMYPERWPARLRISLRDGRVLEHIAMLPRGHFRNPVTRAELEEKFVGLVAPRYSKETAHRALSMIAALPQSEHVDFSL